MAVSRALWGFWIGTRLFAQTVCPPTPAWSSCDLTFDLEGSENPDRVELRAEFRSPHHKTYMLYAFHDADRKMSIRVAPTEEGVWEYRLTSSLPRFDGKEGQFTATPSEAPGFVRVANVHHFATENNKAHLWMATALESFATMPRAEFDAALDQRVKEKFTHLRVTIDPKTDLREAAERIRAINAKGLVADVAFSAIPDQKYLTGVINRFAGFNVTWMGLTAFENTPGARKILKDAGPVFKKYDPYNHPRTSLAAATSAPLLGDDWMSVIGYGTPDPNIGAVEHQLYQSPGINSGIKNQRDLWNATMNGQYPASGSGAYMAAWFDFMAGNRYWELEPYFDVDGARALALEGVEYVVYVEKAGPVEVTLEKHNYDVAWINPANGELIKEKNYNGEHFTGEPPDKSHDWVLHISREGTKEGMLRSWKFESRPVPIQEIEQSPQRVPFDIGTPSETDLSLSKPLKYAIKIKRDTRATRSFLIEWTGEVVIDGEGYRVVGTGREGTLEIPRSLIKGFPAVFSLRIAALNANGKAYVVDKVYRLAQ